MGLEIVKTKTCLCLSIMFFLKVMGKKKLQDSFDPLTDLVCFCFFGLTKMFQRME